MRAAAGRSGWIRSGVSDKMSSSQNVKTHDLNFLKNQPVLAKHRQERALFRLISKTSKQGKPEKPGKPGYSTLNGKNLARYVKITS